MFKIRILSHKCGSGLVRPPSLQGYFLLAKARYSMGVQSVGKLQYDSIMAATAQVSVDSGRVGVMEEEEEEKGVSEESRYVTFEVYSSKKNMVGNKLMHALKVIFLSL